MIAHGTQFSKIIVKISILSVITLFSLQCTNNNAISCKEAFDKYYDKNVEMFMKQMPSDIPPSVAEKQIEFILNELYKRDSNFVFLSGKKLNNFIKENEDVIVESKKL